MRKIKSRTSLESHNILRKMPQNRLSNDTAARAQNFRQGPASPASGFARQTFVHQHLQQGLIADAFAVSDLASQDHPRKNVVSIATNGG